MDIRQKSGHGFLWNLKQFGATAPWWLSNLSTCPSASSRNSVVSHLVRALGHLLCYIFHMCFEAEHAALRKLICNKGLSFSSPCKKKTATIYKWRSNKSNIQKFFSMVMLKLPVLYKYKSKTSLLWFWVLKYW